MKPRFEGSPAETRRVVRYSPEPIGLHFRELTFRYEGLDEGLCAVSGQLIVPFELRQRQVFSNPGRPCCLLFRRYPDSRSAIARIGSLIPLEHLRCSRRIWIRQE